MKVIFFSAFFTGVGEKIFEMMESTVPKDMLEIYLSIHSLTTRLREPVDNLLIGVIVSPKKDSLLDLLSISHLLQKIRIILVIPDHGSETIALAHRLRPRYLAYTDSNFLEVGAVLKKMITNVSKKDKDKIV